MIGRLRGEIAEVTEDRLCVDVHGVGYEVLVPSRVVATSRVGEPLVLHVHTAVREDAITLFGFASARERGVFEQLIAVSGIGPKLALATLSAMTPEALGRAVATNDLRALSAISGVGKKTAERMVLELRGKLAVAPDAPEAAALPTAATPVDDPLALALAQLGYRRAEIEQAAAQLAARGLDGAALPERVRAALGVLGGGR
ncbi:MAG: holliday junction helicase [Pseudomonadota bacterium]|jgi:Holliday junction DNA helicase RuvA